MLGIPKGNLIIRSKTGSRRSLIATRVRMPKEEEEEEEREREEYDFYDT